MTIVISPAKFKVIETVGYGISGDIGGLQKQTYYTPDGRVIKAIPQIRGWIKKDAKGNGIESGTRDANLDKGLLLEKPKELKLFCPHCDRWHDTQVEVEACKIQQDKMIELMTKKTKEEEIDKTVALEQQVAELKAMVEKLLEAQGGKVLQP